MEDAAFSPIEKTISFYTRNDFAILNSLLIGDKDALRGWAQVAYQDNRGILDEYGNGTRTAAGDYDVKWIRCLRERLIDRWDDAAERKVIDTAKSDIANILKAMTPAEESVSLFRTAWVDRKYDRAGVYAYSREYRALAFSAGDFLELQTISSFSLTPYREDEDVGSDFYRYEIRVPKGNNILRLDPFICHNEDGEVLLPPMRCKVVGIRGGEKPRCRGIISLAYVEQLPCGICYT